jgi:hypothetical protein
VKRERFLSLVSLTVIASLFSLAPPMKADVVFSNIVGNCCGGFAVDGANYGSVSLGASFIPAANYLMIDAQVMVFQMLGFGGDPFFNASLFSDASGLPGSLIATIGTGLMAPVGGGIVTASGPMPSLTSGTPYWLVLTPFDNVTELGWEMGGSPLVFFAFTTSSTGVGGWVSAGTADAQFQIDGTPVPEPSSLLLVASGALGAMGIARRRLYPG